MASTLVTRRRMLAGCGLALALAGCGGLPLGNAPPKLYTLTPKSSFNPDLPMVDWQLAIDQPTSPAALSTSRIAVARGPHTIDYYAGAQWIDDAPHMVQRLMIESFENSKRIVGVGRQSVSLRSDFVLRVELREFQAQYDENGDAPTINVRIGVKLVGLPERRIVASTTIERLETSPDNRMSSIIGSFDVALGKVLRDVVEWTLTRPETDR